MDPRKLRSVLRAKFGKNRRWQWLDESDLHYQQVRQYLLHSSTNKNSSTCSGETKTTTS